MLGAGWEILVPLFLHGGCLHGWRRAASSSTGVEGELATNAGSRDTPHTHVNTMQRVQHSVRGGEDEICAEQTKRHFVFEYDSHVVWSSSFRWLTSTESDQFAAHGFASELELNSSHREALLMTKLHSLPPLQIRFIVCT